MLSSHPVGTQHLASRVRRALKRRVCSYTSKPNPFMQLRYWSMVDWQSLAGSAEFENNMHSSRFDFSSLQTQHGCIKWRVSFPLNFKAKFRTRKGHEPLASRCSWSQLVAPSLVLMLLALLEKFVSMNKANRRQIRSYVSNKENLRVDICEPILSASIND